MEMAQLMKAGKQLIYVDESMFYSTLTCDRVWVYRGMTLSKPKDKYSCSVIGAISDKQGLLHYQILTTYNDKVSFSTFISELVHKVKGEAYVYMDNATVHTAGKVQEHFNERVQARYLPKYSCALNPIERLWHLTKARWKKLMVEQPNLINNKDDLVREVNKVIESYRHECQQLASCHLEQMVDVLKGKFV